MSSSPTTSPYHFHKGSGPDGGAEATSPYHFSGSSQTSAGGGGAGECGSRSPSRPADRKPKRTYNELLHSLGLCPGGTRADEAVLLGQTFTRLCSCSRGGGHAGEELERDTFVEDAMLRGYAMSAAKSLFRAFDLDKRGAMSEHEYILGWAALNYDHARDNGTQVNDLRFRYAFDLFDVDANGFLDRNELTEMIRAMCGGSVFVKNRADKVLAHVKPGAVDKKIFLKKILPIFQKHNLHARDLLDGFDMHVADGSDGARVTGLVRGICSPRIGGSAATGCVLDTRVTMARAAHRFDPLQRLRASSRVRDYSGDTADPRPQRQQLLSPPLSSPSVGVGSGGGGGGGGGGGSVRPLSFPMRPALRAAGTGMDDMSSIKGTAGLADLRVSSHIFPAAAYNEECIIATELMPQHPWRGALCPDRASAEYNTAARVVDNAQELVGIVAAEGRGEQRTEGKVVFRPVNLAHCAATGDPSGDSGATSDTTGVEMAKDRCDDSSGERKAPSGDGAHRIGARRVSDCADETWMPDGKALAVLMGSTDPAVIVRRFQRLADEVRRISQAQSSLLRMRAPAKIFGDVHGQLRDLLLLFKEFGMPSHRGGDVETTSYVFNGDFVDRGQHQLAVVALLFALKVAYPARIALVRGNHEFRQMNKMMTVGGHLGFDLACSRRLGGKTNGTLAFESAHRAFDWLPIGALVGNAVLCIHGGIGDGKWGLRELATAVPRPLQDPWDDGVPDFVKQVVWSDPSESDANMARGVHVNPERGEDLLRFDESVTRHFCRRERVSIIVRSHQVVDQGFKIMHAGRCITVFSARNYTGRDTNDGAMLLVAEDGDGMLRLRPKQLRRREEDESHKDECGAAGGRSRESGSGGGRSVGGGWKARSRRRTPQGDDAAAGASSDGDSHTSEGQSDTGSDDDRRTSGEPRSGSGALRKSRSHSPQSRSPHRGGMLRREGSRKGFVSRVVEAP